MKYNNTTILSDHNIDLIIENNLQTGVQGAPSNKIAIEYFFKVLSDHLIKINYK